MCLLPALCHRFHLHDFVLPIINGPNEGIIATVIVYLYTAYAGASSTRLPPLAAATTTHRHRRLCHGRGHPS